MGVLEYDLPDFDDSKPAATERRDPEKLALRIATKHGVTVGALKGKMRYKHLVAARVELYAALRAWGWSYPAIGEFVGHRDHTTVLWALLPAEKRAARREQRKIKAGLR